MVEMCLVAGWCHLANLFEDANFDMSESPPLRHNFSYIFTVDHGPRVPHACPRSLGIGWTNIGSQPSIRSYMSTSLCAGH